MQNESKRAGGKPSKWYFNLTTQVLVAMFLGALAGLALLLGVERFMSMGRGPINMIGNAVATVVVAKSEGELNESGAIEEYRRHFADPAISAI